jgi:hypothetical protein
MTRSRSRKRIALWIIGVAVVIFVLIQFVPYGRDHSAKSEPNPFLWASPEAQAIAEKSCYDCHSNQTKWWWGVKIAPMSWLAQHDIDGAQESLNFSDWDGALTAAELEEAVNGGMPPLQYVLMHPGAKLSDAEKQTLVNGFSASLAQQQGGTTTPAAGASPTPSASPAGSSSPQASADALAILNSRCSVCHAAPVDQRFASAADAQALIEAMISRGAKVTPAEEQVLIDYFTR